MSEYRSNSVSLSKAFGKAVTFVGQRVASCCNDQSRWRIAKIWRTQGRNVRAVTHVLIERIETPGVLHVCPRQPKTEAFC